MILFLLMCAGCLIAAMPLAIATALKAKRIGSIVCGILGVGIAAVCGYLFSAGFLLAEASIALPVIVFGGSALLCIVWTVFLYLTADEHN